MPAILSRLQRLGLAVLLALPLAAGDAGEQRAGDCQAPHTWMLRVSPETRALVGLWQASQGGGVALQYPDLPVDPLDLVIVGRLERMQMVTQWVELRPALAQFTRAVAQVKFNRAPGAPDPAPGAGQSPDGEPPWLQALATRLDHRPQDRVGYLHLEDPLHAISISRFHFLMRRNEPSGGAAPEVFSIMDMGSLSGAYLDGIRIAPHVWVPLRWGSRIRFDPLTKRAKAYLERIRAAGGGPPSFAGLRPLQLKDLHMEYVFSPVPPAEALAAREAWLRAIGRWVEPMRRDAQPSSQGAQVEAPQNGANVSAASAAGIPRPISPGPDAGAQEEAKKDSPLPDAPSQAGAAPENALLGDLAQPLTCGICWDMMVDPVTLGCGHGFCLACIQGWFRTHPDPTCPLCRTPHHQPLTVSIPLRQVVEAWQAHGDPAARAAWAVRVLQQRNRVEAQAKQ